MPGESESTSGNRRVRCPRCELRMSERLHMITASDGFNCPRCQGMDGLTITMFIDEGDYGRFAISERKVARLVKRR